eukprot:COSAG01_NODE_6234_length_3776_cov_65.869731_2_plen_192_part_00
MRRYEAAPTDLLHYALVEVLKAAIVGGDLSVAENILLSGTMGGLARFMVSTFRKVPRCVSWQPHSLIAVKGCARQHTRYIYRTHNAIAIFKGCQSDAVHCDRGICAAHMVELANMVESAPELSEILHRSLPTWAEFVGVEIAVRGSTVSLLLSGCARAAHSVTCFVQLENEKRRHVFDQQDQYGDQYGELG